MNQTKTHFMITIVTIKEGDKLKQKIEVKLPEENEYQSPTTDRGSKSIMP